MDELKPQKGRANQEEEFLTAFHQYNDALFRHAFVRLSNREKAIDLVHDTFTKVWGYMRSGHEVDQYRPFLYKVLNNLIVDEYRKRKEASLDALFEKEGVDEGTFEELSESNTEALAATIDGRQAMDLVYTLPDSYREVLVMRFVDGLGPKEMSELIEVSENVISVRLHRGLKMLRDKIESENKAAEERREQNNS